MLEIEQQINLVKKHKCPLCGVKVRKDDFKDKLALEEFNKSGICNKCQNKMLGFSRSGKWM
jgi:DNA repair exonuclease SbcCD ATPase subunit